MISESFIIRDVAAKKHRHSFAGRWPNFYSPSGMLTVHFVNVGIAAAEPYGGHGFLVWLRIQGIRIGNMGACLLSKGHV
jgi:hypothetical protein